MINKKDLEIRLNKALERFKKLKSLDDDSQGIDLSNDDTLNNVQVLIKEMMLNHKPKFHIDNPPKVNIESEQALEFANLMESYVDFVQNPRRAAMTLEELRANPEFRLINYIVNAQSRHEYDICDVSVKPSALKILIAKAEKPYVEANMEEQFDILMDVAFGLWRLSSYLQEAEKLKNPGFLQMARGYIISEDKKSYQICDESVKEILALAGINPNINLRDLFDLELKNIDQYKQMKKKFVNHAELDSSYEALLQELEQLNSNVENSAFKAARVKYLRNIIERKNVLNLVKKSIDSSDSEHQRKLNVKKHKDLSRMFKVDNSSDYSLLVDRLLYSAIDKCFNREDVNELVESNPKFFAFKKACENLNKSSRVQMMTSQAIKFLREKIIDNYADIENDDSVVKAIGLFAMKRSAAKKMFNKILARRDDVEIAHLAIAASQLADDNYLIRPNPNRTVPGVTFSPTIHPRKAAEAPKPKAKDQVDIKKSKVEHSRREHKLELFQQQMQMTDMVLKLFEQPLCQVDGNNMSVLAWSELPVGNKSLEYKLKNLKAAMHDIKMKLAEENEEIFDLNLTTMDEVEYQQRVTEKLRNIEQKSIVKLQAGLNDAVNDLVNSVYKNSPKVVSQVIIAAAQTQALIESRYNLEDFTKSLIREEFVGGVVSSGESYWAIFKSKLSSVCFDGVFLNANLLFDFNSGRPLIENLKSILSSNNDVVSDSLKSLKKVVECSQYAENFQILKNDYAEIKKGAFERLMHEQSGSNLYRKIKGVFEIFTGIYENVLGVMFSIRPVKSEKIYESVLFEQDGQKVKIDKHKMIHRESIATILDLEFEQQYGILKRSIELMSAFEKYKTKKITKGFAASLKSQINIDGDQEVCVLQFKIKAIKNAVASIEKYSPEQDFNDDYSKFIKNFRRNYAHLFDAEMYSGLIASNDRQKMEKFVTEANIVLAEIDINQYKFDSNDFYMDFYKKISTEMSNIKPEDHYEITGLEIIRYLLSLPNMMQKVKMGLSTMPHIVIFSYEMNEHYKRVFEFAKSVTKLIGPKAAYDKLNILSSFKNALRHFAYDQMQLSRDLEMADKFVDNFNHQDPKVLEQVGMFGYLKNYATQWMGYGQDTYSPTEEKEYKSGSPFFMEELQNDFAQLTYKLAKDVLSALYYLNVNGNKDKDIIALENMLQAHQQIIEISNNPYLKSVVKKLKNNKSLSYEELHDYDNFKHRRLDVVLRTQEILATLYNGKNIVKKVDNDKEFNMLMLLRYANDSLMSMTTKVQKAIDTDNFINTGYHNAIASTGIKDFIIHGATGWGGDSIRSGLSFGACGGAVSAFQSFVKEFKKESRNNALDL